MTQHITTKEAIDYANRALALAEKYQFAEKNTRDMLGALADILDKGRNEGKSPAALVDAIRRDLRRLSEGKLNHPNDVRRTADVVYGREAVDASQREAEAVLELIGFLSGKQ